MRSGETLIKLAKHKVDSVQKLMLAAQKIHDDLNKKLQDLDKVLEVERENAKSNPNMAINFPAYLKSWSQQRANVEASMVGVEEEIASLKEELSIAFEEQKKFETIEDRRQAHALEQQKAREQKSMDEFSITRAKRV